MHLMNSVERSAICLFNWNSSATMVDDGSYINWLEGTRVLEDALRVLPLGVMHVSTDDDHPNPDAMSPDATVAAIRDRGYSRVILAGNFVESEVLSFALRLIKEGLDA